MRIVHTLRLALPLLAAPLGSLLAAADSSYLSHGEDEGFKCAGIYGSPGEHTGRRSVIEIEIPPVPPSDIALAIFDYPDIDWIGIPVKNGAKVSDAEAKRLGPYISSGGRAGDGDVQRFVICDNETITMDLCSDADMGRPLLNDRDDNGQPRSFRSVIYSDYLMLNRSGIGYTQLEYKSRVLDGNSTDKSDEAWRDQARTSVVDGATLDWSSDGTLKVRYYVNTTGFYCVDAASIGDFTARVDWIDVHGLLPASEHPKMHIYLALTIAYITIAVAWAFMSWRVWSEILPVQNQLLGLVSLLAVDMGMNFGFWRYYNSTGAPSTVYS
ncbi:hypothetical protein H4S02_008306, partial [Coemansia sp. RSA 2611]